METHDTHGRVEITILKLSNKKILEFIKKRLPKEWFLIRRCNRCNNFRFLKNSVNIGICNFFGSKVSERFGCVYWKAKIKPAVKQ